jgi:hypothetical protein
MNKKQQGIHGCNGQDWCYSTWDWTTLVKGSQLGPQRIYIEPQINWQKNLQDEQEHGDNAFKFEYFHMWHIHQGSSTNASHNFDLLDSLYMI